MKLALVWALLASVSLKAWGQQGGCTLYRKAPANPSCCASSNQYCCKDNASGRCYCDNYAAATASCFSASGSGSSDFLPVLANTGSQCCGSLKQRTFNTCFFAICTSRSKTYEYWPSQLETSGLCKRDPTVTFYQRYSTLPTLGPCTCKKEATGCVDPNVKPTTPTPTKPTTPTPPNKVCPTAPARTFGRMLGGTPVGDSCSVNGVFNFRVGPTQICNGVLGYNPATQTNQMFLTEFCLNLAKAVAKLQKITAVGFYNSVPFEVKDDVVGNPVGNRILTIPPPPGVLPMSRCQTTACLYNPATMSTLIDFSSCFVPSYGNDYKIGGTSYNSGSLNQVSVYRKGSCATPAVTPNAQCFAATNPVARGCWGDNGAPVYCKLTTTKETVLYGMVDSIGKPPEALTGVKTADLCESTNEFHVLTLPM